MARADGTLKMLIRKVILKRAESYQQFPRHIRHKVSMFNIKPITAIRIPSEYGNKQGLAEFLKENFGTGTFVGNSWHKKKCKDGWTRTTLTKELFRVQISEKSYRFTHTKRIKYYRYWWRMDE